LVDPSAARHVGSLEMIAYPPPASSFLDVTTQRAEDYWRGEGGGLTEIISLSDLKIEACLQ